MDYIITGLLIAAVVLLVILLVMNVSSARRHFDTGDKLVLTEKNISRDMADLKFDVSQNINELKNGVNTDLGDFRYSIKTQMNEDFAKLDRTIEERFDRMNEQMEKRLEAIDRKVNGRLDENFEKTNKTFNDVIARLAKIDEAQNKIESLSGEIVDLQSVLTDKKTRGVFGEVTLSYILTAVFGNGRKAYDLQKTLSNGLIADSVVYVPEPLGMICIDSKFPLENYQRMTDRSLDENARREAERLFKINVKKHIDDIASKYIITGETSDQAILFLPAEAIFAEINAYHPDLVEYSYTKKVWIAGPTTLMSTLTIIQTVLRNIERDRYTQEIHQELGRLAVEFDRYRQRWGDLSKSIDKVSREVKDISTTTEKITKRFDTINKVEMLDIDTECNE